ncbi:NADH dehydrogenase [ubiquinone] 1 beta subcomplex subunit 3 [Phymastichus coffea]|uniref:NADH dehydrogenase [ubiquinone] 1 beta subcomplex subunit 3 n=1 Tax=Phymastichus coffea TaxID=108790 RepID=UPI00273B41D9|nr:NADH dehydrogenase [ubiquinone] 1 beta subcomplex subunit 3 [Phymastichus coffea]
MGGHDHHHVKTPPVPDASIYKVEDYPYLNNIQKRLAKHGLKDPWLRNHVWREMLKDSVPKYKRNWIMLDMLTRGWKLWVPLVGLTIAVEQFLGIDYHAHGHGDEHTKHH